jgi:hypothetical protein
MKVFRQLGLIAVAVLLILGTRQAAAQVTPGCSIIVPACNIVGAGDVQVTVSATGDQVTFYNPNTFALPVGVAVFQKFDEVLWHQQLFSKKEGAVTAGATLTLSAPGDYQLPDCRYQFDAYVGQLDNPDHLNGYNSPYYPFPEGELCPIPCNNQFAPTPSLYTPGSDNFLAALHAANLPYCTPPQSPCSDCSGGVTSLTLKYLDPAGTHSSTPAQITVKAGTTVLNSTPIQVLGGATFTITGSRSDGRFSSNDLDFFVDGTAASNQVGSLHVSCSDVIAPPTTDESQGKGSARFSNGAADLEVTEAISRDGGLVCPLNSSLSCSECKGGVTQLTLKFLGASNSYVSAKAGSTLIFAPLKLNNGDLFTMTGSRSDGKFLSNDLDFFVGTTATNGTRVGSLHVSCSDVISPGTTDESQTKGRTRFSNSQADFEVADAFSKDGGRVCAPTTPTTNCMECKGGVINLTLKFLGSDNSSVTVKAGSTVIYGPVVLDHNEQFTLVGSGKDGKFPKNDLDFFVGTTQIGSLHVSCSDVIYPGTTDESQTKGRTRFSNSRADVEVVEAISKDGGVVCPAPPSGGTCSECSGGVISLTLKYLDPSGTHSTTAAQITVKAGSVLVNSTPILVKAGETFTIIGSQSDGRFASNDLDFYVDGTATANKVGSLHVSCSDVISPGTTDLNQTKGYTRTPESHADFQVTMAISRNGGVVCTPSGSIH